MRSFENAAVDTVYAVIVIFHPQTELICALVKAISPQVRQVVVIDNGSSEVITSSLTALNIVYLKQIGNQGLADGFNIGIRYALEKAASHVILFDQDSLPSANLVAGLLAAEQGLLGRQIEPAAVGPVYSDVKTNTVAPIIGFENFYTKKKYKVDFGDYIEAGYLISSGQLIRRAMLEKVGLMRADLFIDAVDMEWSLRAGGRGFRSFGIAGVTMLHNLGDQSVRIGGLLKPIHGPLRHYYIIRNALLLCRSEEIALRWKIAECLKTVRRLVAYAIFCEKPLQHIKWMARGVRDGLLGRAGPAPDRDEA